MKTIFKQILLPSLMMLSLVLPGVGALAQSITVKAALDSTVIVIGGQVGLNLEASMPLGVTLRFPALGDTITRHVEVVSVGKIDSTISNGLMTLHQRYVITSFDSGLHYIPPFRFEEILSEGELSHQTASLAINVVNPFEKVDPAEGITDIKPPYDLPFSLAELLRYLPYVAAVLLAAALITVLVLYYLRRKGRINPFLPEKPKDPPHVVALRELERIKGEKLWQRNMVKEYYSGISDTLRKYIEERFGIQALEFTSDQTLLALKNIGFSDPRNFDQLKNILNTSDLVKFARFEPLPDEHDLVMIHALFFVNQTKLEEMKSLEEQKEEYRGELEKTSQG